MTGRLGYTLGFALYLHRTHCTPKAQNSAHLRSLFKHYLSIFLQGEGQCLLISRTQIHMDKKMIFFFRITVYRWCVSTWMQRTQLSTYTSLLVFHSGLCRTGNKDYGGQATTWWGWDGQRSEVQTWLHNPILQAWGQFLQAAASLCQAQPRTPLLHEGFFWKDLPVPTLFKPTKERDLPWGGRWRWGELRHPWLVLSCQVSSWVKHCVTDLKSRSSPWFMFWHASPAFLSRTGWIIDLFQYNNFYACS